MLHPVSWQQVTLIEACELYQPQTISKADMESSGPFPVYGANGIIGHHSEFNHPYSEVLLACRGNVGTVNVSEPKSWINGNAMVCRPRDEKRLRKDYLAFALQAMDLRPAITGTAQLQITRSSLGPLPLSIPPVDEQVQIVRILEEQFSRLDAAAASIAAVRRKADQFRRSILHAAFSGGLTQHGACRMSSELPDRWVTLELKDVAKWGSGGTPKSGNPSYYGGEIPWAVIGDLNDGVVSLTATAITQAGVDNSSAKIVPEGTLLLAMYGSIGKLGITGCSMATNQAIAFARADEKKVGLKYLFFYLLSQRQKFLKSGKGATQQNISQTLLKPWPIPIAPLDEQAEIVRILEEQFSRQEAILTVADAADRKVAALRRSLLHAAFSGELTKLWREKHNG